VRPRPRGAAGREPVARVRSIGKLARWHDLDASPTFAEVLKVRADRMALMRGIVDGLTDAALERMCGRAPAPGYPDETRSVGVVTQEECEHHRFAVRDLEVLEAR